MGWRCFFMSSKKTENIQLNQWEPQDNFLREEFNEDNRRLDAALGELRHVTLLDVTTESEAAQVDLDLSAVDFLEYLRLEFYVLDCTAKNCVWLRTNGISEGYSYYYNNGSNTTTLSYMCQLFLEVHPIRYNFCFPAKGIPVAMEGQMLRRTVASDGTVTNERSLISGASPVTWEDLKSLNFVGLNCTIPAGVRFILLGVKK